MKELTGLSVNKSLTDSEGIERHEIIVITSEIDYEYYEQVGEKVLIKTRKAESFRFFTSNEGIDRLIEDLKKIKEGKE